MSSRDTILPLDVRRLVFEIDGTRLLHDIDLTLAAGKRTVILGPNGAGKSLLLRLSHGLLEPTSGEIVWRGAGTRARPNRQQAMVFQRPVMLRRSVLANLTHTMKVRGVPRNERHERALAALALARAWTSEPQVLFLDEPTASLDPAASRSVETLIGGFHVAGTKIVMATHDLGQARRLADEVVFLHKGRLLEHTPADEFFDNPRTDEGRAFMAGELLW